MKKTFTAVVLCALLLLTACTSGPADTVRTDTADITETQTAAYLTETGTETETDTVTASAETDAAETKGVVETETDKETDTEQITDTVTEITVTEQTATGTVTESPVTTKEDVTTNAPDTTKAPDTETETIDITDTVTEAAGTEQTTTEETTANDTTAPDTAETETAVTTTVYTPEEKTSKPTIKGYVILEPGRALVYGECEEDSSLTVKSENETYKAHSDGKYFAVAAKLNEKGVTSVQISVCADGKTNSDFAGISVKNNRNADNTGVTVTLGSRVIQKSVLPDQYGTNGFSQSEKRSVADAAKYRLNKAEKAAGKPVRLVYIIVPDPLTVYPEELSEEMKGNIQTPNLRMKQAIEALQSVEGVTVIDLTETMKENKQNGKLYYALDSHWTELGAFYGYQTVMKTLGLPYHSLSDYNVVYKDIDDTDMNVYSGVGLGEMYESAPFLSARFTEKTPYGKNKEDTARIWSFANQYFNGKTSKTTVDGDYPSAIMLFDSYGFNIMPYIAEHFSTLVTQPAWRYNADYSLVSEIKPDYIIELIAERDVDELISST